jgi:Xaa-Pro aminopeptidase
VGQAGKRDHVRVERIVRGLLKMDLDAVVCVLPMNVLLVSGYWPVVGTALAVAGADGRVVVVVPEDERELAAQGWADEVVTYAPASLDEMKSVIEAVREPLRQATRNLQITHARIGCEGGAVSAPASYVGTFSYRGEIFDLLGDVLPAFENVGADGLLAELRAIPTPYELERIRTACDIAGAAFQAGVRRLQPGLKETEAAVLFRAPLAASGEGCERADGFAFCMSGPNAACAYAAYQQSRARKLQTGDLVLIHCNSYADGYWTDITRTYCLGGPDERQRAMYRAMFDARAAALAAIHPGVRAAEVDRAARAAIASHGFGNAFKHPTGHGVGFAAIDHNAPPRLHPKSEDMLKEGMVFNVEPGIYVEGYGGMRHCDMVVVTADGALVLTPFQTDIAELIVA